MTDAEFVREIAQPLAGEAGDYNALLQLIDDARFVLIGEASHGTHEFYFERAAITKRLIAEKDFSILAIEADWPDSARVHRYVRGVSSDANPDQALSGFRRFPTWMWRNKVVLEFVEWLRGFNEKLDPKRPPVGFYGMDLYSLHASIEAVLRYLDKVDPEAARRARLRYSCFDHFGHDPQDYAYAATVGAIESCENAVVQQLAELQQRAAEFLSRDGEVAAEEFFFAEQNARLVKDAERYYRAMFRGRASSWNLRDQHMVETLENLVGHLNGSRQPKAIVWAHNSHLGDARSTEMSHHGEVNMGQLVRERFDGDAVLIGFSTYQGTVTAASDWGAPAEQKNVRPALRGSYEDLFHQTGLPRFWIDLQGAGQIGVLQQRRLERAIGVIYRPETERLSHYFHARLPEQFDAFIHIDKTRAVEPLERTSIWEEGELPETYPFTV
ncbi:MAG: erythromycin esterase [Verrucomicrobia bacterium]|nr:MAG: erythromycin esterase [Verrucomicrobiota bacterium]